MVLNKGVVMVPVRTVAEAIGKSVEWDAKKNMVYIGTTSYPENTGTTGTIASTQTKQEKMLTVTTGDPNLRRGKGYQRRGTFHY